MAIPMTFNFLRAHRGYYRTRVCTDPLLIYGIGYRVYTDPRWINDLLILGFFGVVFEARSAEVRHKLMMMIRDYDARAQRPRPHRASGNFPNTDPANFHCAVQANEGLNAKNISEMHMRLVHEAWIAALGQ